MGLDRASWDSVVLEVKAAITDGVIDSAKLKLISRLGYKEYARVENVFSMSRPGDGDKLAGL